MDTTTTPQDTRPGQDLARRLWAGFPFLGDMWPFDDTAITGDATSGEGATGGIRVEEMLDNGLLVIRAELPGIDPENDVEVTVDDGMLSIRAQREERHEERDNRTRRSEFRYGTFVRRVPLPRGSSADVVSASYRDGILEVRMPAPSPSRTPRRVEVERA
ncbi:Hsp20/alpha crystallin family protein [Aquipuribacter nitratireducens]|uniref:Hsp20/alpha crystallin family protein n=1 Tax=Aquipuribacter nitratireducens TaxID=650104 RepID=A0ABW0GJ71_9MICO